MARLPRALALAVLVLLCAAVVRADGIDDLIRARQDFNLGSLLPFGSSDGTDSDSNTGSGGSSGPPNTQSPGNGNSGGSGGNGGPTDPTSSRSIPITTSSTPSTTSSQITTTSSETPSTSTRIIEVTSTPLVSTETRSVVTDVVTVIGGQTSTRPVTSQDLIRHTTGFATPTPAAGLNDGGGSSGSGLSDSSKRIIGGVVGGVGGAILIAAIAFVFFRIRKRRNAAYETDEDIFAKEGRSSSTPNTMFASAHADRYAPSSTPPTVTTSSNF